MVNLRALLATATVVALTATASAGVIAHGDFLDAADCINFVDVSEDNADCTAYFVPETNNGGTLSVDTTGFISQADGIDSMILDSKLEMDICLGDAAAPGSYLTGIDFSESGDYTLAADSLVMASVNWFIQIPGVDGVFCGNVSDQWSQTSGASGDQWSLSTSIDLSPGALLTYCDGSGTYEIPAEGITKVNFEFDNTLTSLGNAANSSAFIAKKDTGGVMIDVHKVPEPSSFALVMLGGMGLVLRRRR